MFVPNSINIRRASCLSPHIFFVFNVSHISKKKKKWKNQHLPTKACLRFYCIYMSHPKGQIYTAAEEKMINILTSLCSNPYKFVETVLTLSPTV